MPREGIDIPLGPPPEEYVYRCQVCGLEDLVNEVIIDVVVGGTKFRGEYQGGMPKLECPTCCRETMVLWSNINGHLEKSDIMKIGGVG